MSEPPHQVVNRQLQSMAASSQEKKRTCVARISVCTYVVSSPDPFPYAHAREIIGGWRKSEGKGLANRVARATVGMLVRLEWNAS